MAEYLGLGDWIYRVLWYGSAVCVLLTGLVLLVRWVRRYKGVLSANDR